MHLKMKDISIPQYVTIEPMPEIEALKSGSTLAIKDLSTDAAIELARSWVYRFMEASGNNHVEVSFTVARKDPWDPFARHK